jgi:hypothetical protein
MRRLPKELRAVDAFCARLNPGLAAVSVMLSIVFVAELTAKLPVLLANAAAKVDTGPTLPILGP